MNFTNFGKYILLLKAVFKKPEKTKIYIKAIFQQMDFIGVGSLGFNCYYFHFYWCGNDLTNCFPAGK